MVIILFLSKNYSQLDLAYHMNNIDKIENDLLNITQC